MVQLRLSSSQTCHNHQSNCLSRPDTVHIHLVIQRPSKVLETFVIQEVLRVGLDPNAQLGNTSGPDVGQLVSVAVHKHAAEHGVYHGTHFLSVLLQLGETQNTHTHTITCKMCESLPLTGRPLQQCTVTAAVTHQHKQIDPWGHIQRLC